MVARDPTQSPQLFKLIFSPPMNTANINKRINISADPLKNIYLHYIFAWTNSHSYLTIMKRLFLLFYILLTILSCSPQRIEINKNIVYVGHSIWWYDGHKLADGVNGGVKAKGYQTLLNKEFKFKSNTNYCYSGFSLGAKGLNDSNSIILNMSPKWKFITNSIWTLDSATNDFKRGIPLGTIDDYINRNGCMTFYGALSDYVHIVDSLSKGTAIVVFSNAIKRNKDNYTSYTPNVLGYTLEDYNKALFEIASLNDFYFVDQFNKSGIDDSNLEYLTIDGLHLNNDGFKQVIPIWVETFKTIYNEKEREH